jgi:hypothetical protein
MPYAFWGVQKDLSRKHLFRHFTRSFWSLLNLITNLFMQALANSIRNVQYFFYLEAPECFHSWCGYTVYSNLGYVIF